MICGFGILRFILKSDFSIFVGKCDFEFLVKKYDFIVLAENIILIFGKKR